MALLRPTLQKLHRAAPPALALVLVAALAAAAATTRGEYEVKAAFLINFANLVEWPDGVLGDGAELRVGILGEAEAAEDLRGRLDGRSVGAHPVRARLLAGPAQAGEDHIVYVTGAADEVLEGVIAATRGRSVLLVGESDDFARRGGIINFYVEKSKVRFEVNPEAARKAGLRVSSRLLSVARIVEGG